MTTAEERADRWEQMAERNIAPVTAELADLYKRLEIAGDQHRELAEQLGDLKAELEKACELLKDAVDALRVELLLNPGHGKLSIVDSATTYL